MGMDRPTLRQLEIFLEVVRAGSFRGAARDLGLSQVAVSDHVRQLERRLGRDLFIRAPGSVPTLSAAGQVAAEHGRNVLMTSDALVAAVAGAAAGPADGSGASLTIVTPVAIDPTPASLPPEPAPEPMAAEPEAVGDHAPTEDPIRVAAHPTIVTRFQERLAAAEDAFPDRPISVDYAHFTADAVAPFLYRGGVEIALVFACGERDLPGSTYLWSEQWSLLVRGDHPLAAQETVTRAQCVDMPVIMLAPDNPLRSICETCLSGAGLWPAPTVLETDDYARIAAELALGEALFPAFGVTASQFAAREGLKRIPLIEPIPAVEVRQGIGPHVQNDPVVAAIAGFLK